MKIAAANLQMASSHASLQHRQVSESMRMWVGQRPAEPNRPPQPVTLSAEARAAQHADIEKTEQNEAVDKDPKLNLIRRMLEALTGQKIRLFDSEALIKQEKASGDASPSAPPGENQPAGYGIEYERHESYTEIESTTFSANGTVVTADGQRIDFALQLSMQRVFHEESTTSLRFGDAARKIDPLILNFNGNAASLSDQRFSFDLDQDGTQDRIALPGSGSGFLVFDRNQDGRINHGGELFGPTTGHGFSELASLDEDGNGWIDENDTAYAQLQIWQPAASGPGTLATLKEKEVGAIALGYISTPFNIANAQNQQLGTIANSGIFLQENGAAGTIQHVDLTA
jgi:hypothetical protein